MRRLLSGVGLVITLFGFYCFVAAFVFLALPSEQVSSEHPPESPAWLSPYSFLAGAGLVAVGFALTRANRR